jgi:diaminopimelate decarboxylase
VGQIVFSAQGRFAYQNGVLHCEAVSLQDLVKVHETPFYVYSSASIKDKVDQLVSAAKKARLDLDIRYSAKVNSNISLLETMAQAGLGVEVVSGGELRTAIAAGFAPSCMIFSGAAKSRLEIESAVKAGVDLISVESLAEARRISEAACAKGAVQKVLARVQGAPLASTMQIVSNRENKFGIPSSSIMDDFEKISRLRGVALEGISFHLGSQITDPGVFRSYFQQIKGLADRLIEAGNSIRTLCIGGGLPADYHYLASPVSFDLEQYMGHVKEVFAPMQCKIIACPGRYIAAEAGVLGPVDKVW